MERLEDIRIKINEIDEQLVPLFLKRMECSRQVGRIKKENNLPVLNQAREDEIVETLTRGLDREDADAVSALYREIFKISRKSQTNLLTD